MATRRLSGMTTSSSVPDNGGDHSGGGGSGGTYVDDVFSTYLYKGTSAEKDIVNDVDLAGEGGLAWLKQRTGSAKPHYLFDTERGNQQSLSSNDNAAAFGSGLKLKAFNSDGFRLGAEINVNGSGEDYTSWTFRKAPKFFDVVTWTGDGVAGREIPHNLGCEPGMVIVKSTSNDSSWIVTHASIPDHYLTLNTADSKQSDVKMVTTDSTISWTGSDVYYNRLGREYVAYLFAHDDSDESMIKCGSYTGNGGGGAPTIDLGWEPQFLMIKNATASGGWLMYDSMRGVINGGSDALLRADSSEAETAPRNGLNFLPNGFVLQTGSGEWNKAGNDYIYMAIRRPNKPAEEFEPEKLFAVNSLRQEPDPGFIAGFPTDFALHNTVNETGSTQASSRLTGTGRLFTDQTTVEGPINAILWDYMDGNRQGNGVANGNEFQWMWRRAPGFMDVVAYEGDSQPDHEVPHNLGVVPEMMIFKRRSPFEADWAVYHSAIGNDKAVRLNTNDGTHIATSQFGSKTPTSSVFTVGNFSTTNNNTNDYIAYLFASVPGISKVGSYTGNGGLVGVDCGFTNGARFVLIKRTDAAGDWMVFDTLRGITNSDSPMLALNTTNAQVNGPYIRGWSTGFRAGTGSGGGETPACIDGAEYIFYAIA